MLAPLFFSQMTGLLVNLGEAAGELHHSVYYLCCEWLSRYYHEHRHLPPAQQSFQNKPVSDSCTAALWHIVTISPRTWEKNNNLVTRLWQAPQIYQQGVSCQLSCWSVVFIKILSRAILHPLWFVQSVKQHIIHHQEQSDIERIRKDSKSMTGQDFWHWYSLGLPTGTFFCQCI